MDKQLLNGEVSSDKSRLQMERVFALLKSTYWAKNRSREQIEKSIENSLCFGVFTDGVQVGFARVITDFATTFYLCDVVVDEAYRAQGLGTLLVQTIADDERLHGLRGMLLTENAHGLYEKFGFRRDGERFMQKPNKTVAE